MPKPESQPHVLLCSGTKRPPPITCIVIENPINISALDARNLDSLPKRDLDDNPDRRAQQWPLAHGCIALAISLL